MFLFDNDILRQLVENTLNVSATETTIIDTVVELL